MPRRRYRAFVFVAIIATFSLYHLTRIPPQSIGIDRLKYLGQHVATTSSLEFPSSTSIARPLDNEDSTPSAIPTLPRPSSSLSTLTQSSTLLVLSEVSATPQSQITPSDNDRLAINESERLSDEEVITDHSESHGQGRIDEHSSSLDAPTWEPQREHFPVPSSLIIHMPTATGLPKRIPAIQHEFVAETSSEKESREQKLRAIKGAFEHAWSGYKRYAMPNDELEPCTGSFKNPFNGWGATLVDSLDTLWIMGLKAEFEHGVAQVGKINFKTSIRQDIPLFETVIRYLGGLIAAYDVSSGQYQSLLTKAVELAEILMGAFDTPNRLPVTYYYWAPSYASRTHRASSNVVLAELGSLSLEFTRLAQITKEDKYYDAVARITDALEAWQNNTKIPGLWPVSVDASGCKAPDGISAHSASLDFLPPIQNPPSIIETHEEAGSQKKGHSELDPAQYHQIDKRRSDDPRISDGEEPASPHSDPSAGVSVPSFDSETSQNSSNPTTDEVDCQPQGLASPHSYVETFTLGGGADSTYEYLPKEYLLLGGLKNQYESMYLNAIDVVKRRLLYRPMTKSGRDVLFAGKVSIVSHGDNQTKHPGTAMDLTTEAQHLTCFIGGMMAIGSKIFGLKDDLELAGKLSDGCIWAYESTMTGIMPEVFHLVPCDSLTQCAWNETKWWEALDPYRTAREEHARTWHEHQELLSQGDLADEAERPGRSSMPVLPSGEVPSELDHELSKRDDGAANIISEGVSQTDQAAELEEAPKADQEPPRQPSETRPRPAESQPEPHILGTIKPLAPAFTPKAIASHQEFVQARIKEERLPPGFTNIDDRKYILRPEAIESVFIMWRVTGDSYWRDQGWKMFTAIQTYTQTEYGNSAIRDVQSTFPLFSDSMESFWLSETLKYFFLLFSEPKVVSLDEWVL
jgi:mannosyl-oligosaccharide alpha-1,2-mannosidase